ncbi:MAG: prolyl oligopeptidase family serine peptidase, partial [Angustibacter sp.]
MPTTSRPRPYPPAHRESTAEVLRVGAEEVPVPDPYRWLEDADADATRVWSAAQEELFQGERAGWTARPRLRDRVATLVGTGAIGTPVWRGARQFVV